jgi:preprotein translocase subunit SecY
VLAVRFLDLVKPFTPLIPEIAVPETKTPFQQRLIWTGVTLLIFLVMSQMPLYGIVSSGELHTYGKLHASAILTATRHLRPALLAQNDDGQ